MKNAFYISILIFVCGCNVNENELNLVETSKDFSNRGKGSLQEFRSSCLVNFEVTNMTSVTTAFVIHWPEPNSPFCEADLQGVVTPYGTWTGSAMIPELDIACNGSPLAPEELIWMTHASNNKCVILRVRLTSSQNSVTINVNRPSLSLSWLAKFIDDGTSSCILESVYSNCGIPPTDQRVDCYPCFFSHD